MSGTGGPIAAATYMLPPMTRTVDVDALEAWIGDPDGAERILIAEGRLAPKMALAWIMAQQWAKAGLIVLTDEPGEKHAGGRRERRWIAARLVCAAPLAVGSARSAAKGGRSTEPLAPDETPVSDHIYRAIKRAANMGQPAPSLSDLATRAGLKAPSNADYYVAKLRQRGKIDVESKRFATGSRRRYHILDEQGRVVRQTDWGR